MSTYTAIVPVTTVVHQEVTVEAESEEEFRRKLGSPADHQEDIHWYEEESRETLNVHAEEAEMVKVGDH